MTQFTDLERERPSRLSEASLRINESLEFGESPGRLLKKRLAAAARGVGRLEAASGFVVVAS